jgi:MHS family proline/betaine transporter-like MFS transporter
MSLFSSLKREQKEAIGLLQIGTFLEYFDLMLYVHMAVLLNDLFFPKADPHTASLIAAFAFCSTYVLRPFGALLFGWIGDNIGRKTTVIITTMMMAVSCLIMANLPTYSQIGISAAWIVTLCRMIQGLASMGELTGAEIYLTETLKFPRHYPIVALLAISSSLGPFLALAVASLVTSSGFNWRLAFWIGAGIALVGSAARTRLRETPEFVDMKKTIKRAIEISSGDGLEKAAQLLKSTNILWKEKLDKKTMVSYFLIQLGWPVFFYFTYMHCGNILKNRFGFTPEQVIHQNFKVSFFQLFSFIIVVFVCKKVNPLLILKIRAYVLFSFVCFVPFVMNQLTSPIELFFLQSAFIFFPLCVVPAVPIFVKHFPVYRRFTCNSFIFASSRVLGYVITSFGIVYLTETFGSYGLWIMMIPSCLSFLWGVHHFEKLERQFETPSNAKEAGEKLIKSPAS